MPIINQGPKTLQTEDAAAILRGEDIEEPKVEKEGDPPEVESGPAETPAEEVESEPELRSLKDLAEKLGTDPKSLYDVEIPLPGDGETVKLGKLKDAYLARADDETARAGFEEEKEKFHSEQMRARDELRALVEHLPQLPPQYVEAVERMESQKVTQENALTLESIPTWADPEDGAINRLGDEKIMAGFVAEWGFSPLDVKAIRDHRLIKMVRDLAMRAQRAENLQRKVTTKKGARPGQQARKTPKIQPRADAKSQAAKILREALTK